MRALTLALLALAFAAPAAHADWPDYLPVYGANDGIRLTQKGIAFGPKADKLYRTLGGHRALALCGAFTDRLAPDYTAGNQLGTLPRKRGTIRVDTGGYPDVCAIATRRINLDDSFCRSMRSELEDWCARVIVAVTPRGRAYVDRLHRAVELVGADDQISSLPPDWAPTPVELLQGAVEAKVVALDGPDASPPAGTIGLYGDGANHTVAALLRDGTRVFLRREGDVITTNLPELFGRALTVFPN
ncbi:hypothetical protein OM076_12235 [Solirubrobacter ginsenosidimutans]|uniref:Uncharacterized protein n=1 Tax=Solirubrobacter ginsenosidimutans TaxID=490573 RepID=A0A9X3S4W8_9ACTN|nr:hypothetical protein [Solirubrobacter ginsenosidimutans]MDA0161038.1 hypothetical protein [Solirubrobacter ginsenosidimutans]